MTSLSILNRQFADMNPLLCGWENCEAGHSYGPACREYYLVHYICSGEGVFERNTKQFCLGAGHMFLIRPGETTFYYADYKNPWSYIWIGFDGTRCEELLDQSPFSQNRETADVPYLNGIFTGIKNSGGAGAPLELALLAKLYEMFALMQEKSSSALPCNYVARAVDFIRANYAMPITIEGIAAMVGIDRRYLCRIFSAETGMSPKEFLVGTRLEKAALLLEKRVNPIAEVARSVGYDDAFNFSRMFKKKYGVSPIDYKSAAKAGRT